MKVDRWNGYLTVSSLVLSLLCSKLLFSLLLLWRYHERSHVCRDLLRANLQQHGREARVVELEVPLVVKLEERRRVGVLLLQVEVVELGLLCRVATVLTHVNL